MSAEELQHQVNVTRRIRTEEYAMMDYKDAIEDPGFSFRSEVITAWMHCCCDDCLEYFGYGDPIQCIDPYLMDIRFSNWSQSHVAASETAAVRMIVESTPSTGADTNNDELSDDEQSDDEPEPKRRKH